MEVERKYATKFFSDEGMRVIAIITHLNGHYGEAALSRSQVYHWIRDVKLGTKRFLNIAPPAMHSE
jgi:hypothetical protein